MNAPDRTTWLAERRTGLGGSDIAAALGLSQYKTPYALWLDKTGRDTIAEPDDEARERMHWGTVLEDVVAREYMARTGTRVQRINATLRHPTHAWALANIDRAVTEPGRRATWSDGQARVIGASGILECKTAHAMALRGAEWGEPGTDQVPQSYYLQALWYMGITRVDRADIACLFGGQRFAVYPLAFDAAIFDDILNQAGEWWQRHVVADTPPPTVTEAETRQRWPRHAAGAARIVGPEIAQAVAELADVKRRIAELEEEEQALRDRVTVAFEDAESISNAGRVLATWKANKDSRKTDWKALSTEWGPPPGSPAAQADIERYTTTTPGARVLRLNTKEV
jgi:putative phage-type endonuclease